ncbi:MAG: signal recognition particle-docking protein FtsY [Bacteroidales bacterium]|jgi:fused signal recognition particle receptor|nr:signal recognition particle-docking protein FtsY [Bacteroidales bacterium]NLK80392.1 signal recognition particle-docking protein FtsY [Bacteroidales bacterium]HKM31828.1 signal recognition particle-docking protein FtsY [Bacteroidales bacterium]HPX79140.1 signal recognition particle-docking protein FtsY [Bacteroidales bacterium]
MTEDILNKGLEKTKKGLFSRLSRVVMGRSRVDDQVLDDIEEALVASDVGVDTTLRIIERLEDRVQKDKYMNTEELNKYLREEIEALLLENKVTNEVIPFDFSKKPYVVLVVGVNGTGKTTTIGKLAAQLKKAGKQVMLGAADTFRAAAIEQLTIWSERSQVPIVKQAMGSDPAAVAYDSLASAISRDMDVLLIDTAGRLHNKVNLMNELAKIKKVLQKLIPDAPHEVLLVLDGSTGQNAYQQAREFSKATDVTALAVTKLDGTAKGGVVIGISDMLQVPVKFIGLGEGIDDLQVFDKKSFVATLFE